MTPTFGPHFAALAQLVLVFGWALIAAPAAGSITNGSFETGDLTGWESIGNVAVHGFLLGPTTDGTHQALLSTEGTYPTCGFACTPAADPTPADIPTIEAFFGATPGSLAPFALIEGSALKMTVPLVTGDLISFDWNFLTNEGMGPVLNEDMVLLTLLIGPGVQQLDTKSVSGVTLQNRPSPFNWDTGFQNFQREITKDGDYTVGVAVFDAGSKIVGSGLIVDNFMITPEPGTLALVMSGIVALGIQGRRRV